MVIIFRTTGTQLSFINKLRLYNSKKSTQLYFRKKNLFKRSYDGHIICYILTNRFKREINKEKCEARGWGGVKSLSLCHQVLKCIKI